ncbi:MAG: hypothetical protein P8N72_19200 [Flavimaricola sp.]|nr:hypothetical protein [Flavimaricola sp.]
MRQTTNFIGAAQRFTPVLATVVAPAFGHFLPSVICASSGQGSKGTDRTEAR